MGVSPAVTLLQVLEDEPVPPTRLHPKAPRDLEVICLKCLQKDPAKRYPSAFELAEDLRRFLNKETILARPTQLLERLYRWSKRNPRPTLLGVLGFVLVLSGLVGSVALYSRLAYLRRQAEAREAAARSYAEELRHSLDQALAAGTALASGADVPGDRLVAWARSYARSSALVAEDSDQAEHYAQQALAFLSRANATGWFREPAHVEQIRNFAEFESLRSRPEFQKLLSSDEESK